LLAEILVERVSGMSFTAFIQMGQSNNILSDKTVRAMEQEEYKKGIWP